MLLEEIKIHMVYVRFIIVEVSCTYILYVSLKFLITG